MTSLDPEDRHQIGVLLVALAAGVVAGVAIGMLLAPASGRETRASIRERNRRLTAIVRQAGVRGLWRRQQIARSAPTPA